MPPRHTYWTIILEGKPTAFRARSQEELLPTLRQLQGRHPDAVLKWFARGRLWDSEVEARAAFERRQRPTPPRDAQWRPGGAHRDPRDRFRVPRDEKRRRFAARQRRTDLPDPGERGPAVERPRRPEGTGPREREPAWNRKSRPERPGGWSRKPEGRGPSEPGRPSGGKPATPGSRRGQGFREGAPQKTGPDQRAPGARAPRSGTDRFRDQSGPRRPEHSWRGGRERGGTRRGPGRKPGGGRRGGGGGGGGREPR